MSKKCKLEKIINILQRYSNVIEGIMYHTHNEEDEVIKVDGLKLVKLNQSYIVLFKGELNGVLYEYDAEVTMLTNKQLIELVRHLAITVSPNFITINFFSWMHDDKLMTKIGYSHGYTAHVSMANLPLIMLEIVNSGYQVMLTKTSEDEKNYNLIIDNKNFKQR